MALDCTVHLRSWILDEADFLLQSLNSEVIEWANALLHQLLDQLTLPELIVEASQILPPHIVEKLLLFTARNYPSELATAVILIIGNAEDRRIRPVH